MVEKVEKEQAYRFVINLDGWAGNMDEMKNQFKTYLMKNLEQIIVVKD